MARIKLQMFPLNTNCAVVYIISYHIILVGNYICIGNHICSDNGKCDKIRNQVLFLACFLLLYCYSNLMSK